jgi:hypothetical protein
MPQHVSDLPTNPQYSKILTLQDIHNYGSKNCSINSRFVDFSLNALTLNISNVYSLYDVVDLMSDNSGSEDRMLWTALNQTYDLEYVRSNGTCQPTKVVSPSRISFVY